MHAQGGHDARSEPAERLVLVNRVPESESTDPKRVKRVNILLTTADEPKTADSFDMMLLQLLMTV
jgi:hypothetical protein